MLLRLYVRLLNKDIGTSLTLHREGRRYYLSGQIRYLVQIQALDGTSQRELAKALMLLDQKAKKELDDAGPAIRTVCTLLGWGVSLERVLDTLDELGHQHLERG